MGAAYWQLCLRTCAGSRALNSKMNVLLTRAISSLWCLLFWGVVSGTTTCTSTRSPHVHGLASTAKRF